MSTKENLKKAFAGESQANHHYLAFAEIADQEGYPGIAILFRAAAEGETVHAHTYLRALGALKTTADHLQDAIAGEQAECKVVYPKFIEAAKTDKDPVALNAFSNAAAVEQVHASLFIEALDAVKNGKDMKSRTVYVCRECGNINLDKRAPQCHVCGGPPERCHEVK